jgi:hypothetical protein
MGEYHHTDSQDVNNVPYSLEVETMGTPLKGEERLRLSEQLDSSSSDIGIVTGAPYCC